MKTIGKTKKYVLPAAGMKNKTAPPGFTRFFRFAGLLPIGAGFAKRNDGPQCPPQAKKNWDLGCVLYKKHKPPRGSAPAAGGNFLGIWGDVLHKNHVAGVHSGTCFWRKTPPKSSKISACGEPNPPNVSLITNFSRFRTLFTNFSGPTPPPPLLPVKSPFKRGDSTIFL